ncbi:MAG: hypothetical protein IPG04_33630 [Polyangiaceae bacterium]|nr:hypothetical protein [Polyangiaceae bacterium]
MQRAVDPETKPPREVNSRLQDSRVEAAHEHQRGKRRGARGVCAQDVDPVSLGHDEVEEQQIATARDGGRQLVRVQDVGDRGGVSGSSRLQDGPGNRVIVEDDDAQRLAHSVEWSRGTEGVTVNG